MQAASGAQDASADILLPYADLVFIIPFWMSAIHRPLPHDQRKDFMGRVAERLNDLKPAGLQDWRADAGLYAHDPFRLRWLIGARLIVSLPPPLPFLEMLEACLEESGHKDRISCSLLESPALRYENFGTGTIEYVVRLRLRDSESPEVWLEFLKRDAFWAGIDMVTAIEEGSLSIQGQWQEIRNAMHGAIRAEGLSFPELEAFIQPGDRGGASKKTRTDELSWTYCYHLILYRDPARQVSATKRDLEQMVDEIGGHVDHSRPDYAQTKRPFLPLGNGSLDVLYSGFSFVALISEPHAAGPDAPSLRIRALWRQFHLNYATLTDASHLFQEVIAGTLRLPHGDGFRSEQDIHDELRQITAAVAMMRYRATPTNLQTDDLETVVYGEAANAWSMKDVDSALALALEDADRATSRASESKRQNEERRLNYLVCFLALLTIISVLQDFTQFISGENPSQWQFGQFLFRFSLLCGIIGIAAYIVLRFELLPIWRSWRQPRAPSRRSHRGRRELF